MAEWPWSREKRKLVLLLNISETLNPVEAGIQSRNGHENKSYRNSQKSWEKHETSERTKNGELELINFRESI